MNLIYCTMTLDNHADALDALLRVLPHVDGAVKYMDELRLSERTEANRAKNQAFYGMMPASISQTVRMVKGLRPLSPHGAPLSTAMRPGRP